MNNTRSMLALGAMLAGGCNDNLPPESEVCDDQGIVFDSGKTVFTPLYDHNKDTYVRCLEVKYEGRDCDAVRSRYNEIVTSKLPQVFECDKNDNLTVKDAQALADFQASLEEAGDMSPGNCADVVSLEQERVSRMWRDMTCEDGKPTETLGWERYTGGVTYRSSCGVHC